MNDSSRRYNSPASLNRSYGGHAASNQRARTIAALAPKTGDAILDVGCGSGFLTFELADAVGEAGSILAVDHNPEMIDAALERCAALPQVQAEVQDVANLSLPDQRFDAATCTQVLLYVEDVAGAIAEMARVVKPGGSLVILETDWRSAVLHSENPALTEQIFASWDQAVPNPNLPVHLAPLLRDAGLVVEHVEAIPMLETRYDTTDFLAGSVDWLARAAVKQGAIDESNARAWVAGIEGLGASNRYFSCVNRFLFMARKPISS